MVWSDASSCSEEERRRSKVLEGKLREERSKRKQMEIEMAGLRKDVEVMKREVRKMRGRMDRMEKEKVERGRERSRGPRRTQVGRTGQERERTERGKREENVIEKMEVNNNEEERMNEKGEDMERDKIRKGLAAVVRTGRKWVGGDIEEWLEGKIGIEEWWCKFGRADGTTVKVFLDTKERKRKLLDLKQESKEDEIAFIDDWLTWEERRERTLLWIEAEKLAKAVERMDGRTREIIKEDKRVKVGEKWFRWKGNEMVDWEEEGEEEEG